MAASELYSSYLVVLLYQITIIYCNQNASIGVGHGTIKGLRANDGDYYMYLGIPYAKVDKSNHFASAIPYVINDVYEAYDDSIICPQVNEENNAVGAIDCLRLNVYVPITKHSSDTLLPVMVWIYGDYFQYGSYSRHIYGPKYLVQHNVIVVTFNYRTGPYGFMCLDIPEVSGNQGLKDQYQAIRWVKDNIESFGGNPERITLFGQGAGGHSIDLHLMSTRERLFNNIIIQSGSAQTSTVLQKPDKSAPLKLARYAGLETNDIYKAIWYLTTVNTNLVVYAASRLNITLQPCVESLFDNVVPFIDKSWINAKAPEVKNLPVILGFTELEMATLFMKNDEYFDHFSINSSSLSATLGNDNVRDPIALISRFYFGDEEINSNLKWDVIRFASDFTYIHPIHRSLKKYLENGANPVYFYMFSYIGSRNAVVTRSYDNSDKLCCASHGDDLGYLFSRLKSPGLYSTDMTTMERMTTMWTNFAKYGDPTAVISDLLPEKWQPITANTYHFLNIDTELSMKKRPLHERMAFWDVLYDHYKLYKKGYEDD